MRVVLPLPPNVANGRMHWRTKLRRRQDYETRCDVLAKVEGEPLDRARMTATLYTWSTMDTDNLVARLKWAVDWMVKRGYLADDSPDCLVWEMPAQAIDRKAQRVEIMLEAL